MSFFNKWSISVVLKHYCEGILIGRRLPSQDPQIDLYSTRSPHIAMRCELVGRLFLNSCKYCRIKVEKLSVTLLLHFVGELLQGPLRETTLI